MKTQKTYTRLQILSINNLMNKQSKNVLEANFYRSSARRHDMVVEKELWVQEAEERAIARLPPVTP